MQTARVSKDEREVVEPRPTRGSNELDEILFEDGAIAKAIKKHFSRTVLWRFRTGRRIPDFDAMKEIRKLTQGRIVFDWWAEEGPARRCPSCGRS